MAGAGQAECATDVAVAGGEYIRNVTWDPRHDLDLVGESADQLVHDVHLLTGDALSEPTGAILQAVMAALEHTPPELSADTPVYLAVAPEVEGVTGKYFRYRRAIGTSEALATSRFWMNRRLAELMQ